MSSREPQERSAGGVVVRDEQLIAIVPRRRAADGSRVLGLPKGHIDAGETALQAALREVREEAGVTAEPLGELGEVRYWYRRAGRTIPKSVVFYLLRYTGGDLADHDDEVEEARWMGLAQAAVELTYDGERKMAQQALQALGDRGRGRDGEDGRKRDGEDGRERDGEDGAGATARGVARAAGG